MQANREDSRVDLSRKVARGSYQDHMNQGLVIKLEEVMPKVGVSEKNSRKGRIC